MMSMESLEKVPVKNNLLEKALLEQGIELISIKFIDEETFFYITRKIENNEINNAQEQLEKV